MGDIANIAYIGTSFGVAKFAYGQTNARKKQMRKSFISKRFILLLPFVKIAAIYDILAMPCLFSLLILSFITLFSCSFLSNLAFFILSFFAF